MAKYKRNYLTSVIVRLDFTIPPSDIDRELPDELAKKIARDFPTPATPVDCVQRLIAMNPTGNLQVPTTERWKRWDFYTARRDRFLRIERDFYCIQYKKYQSFQTLKTDFRGVLNLMAEAFPDVTYRRLGLRYVDTFSFPHEENPLDWRRWIAAKLLAPLAVPSAKDRQAICRAMQNLELNCDGVRLRFQYGIPNPDYPSPVRQKQFVFDTDVFCEGLLEPSDMEPKLNKFHEIADQYFEDHITAEMRRHLNAPRSRRKSR